MGLWSFLNGPSPGMQVGANTIDYTACLIRWINNISDKKIKVWRRTNRWAALGHTELSWAAFCKSTDLFQRSPTPCQHTALLLRKHKEKKKLIDQMWNKTIGLVVLIQRGGKNELWRVGWWEGREGNRSSQGCHKSYRKLRPTNITMTQTQWHYRGKEKVDGLSDWQRHSGDGENECGWLE